TFPSALGMSRQPTELATAHRGLSFAQRLPGSRARRVRAAGSPCKQLVLTLRLALPATSSSARVSVKAPTTARRGFRRHSTATGRARHDTSLVQLRRAVARGYRGTPLSPAPPRRISLAAATPIFPSCSILPS